MTISSIFVERGDKTYEIICETNEVLANFINLFTGELVGEVYLRLLFFAKNQILVYICRTCRPEEARLPVSLFIFIYFSSVSVIA